MKIFISKSLRSKTASLLSSACAVGAWSTSKDEICYRKNESFGEKIGIAFQIKDDLFDYGTKISENQQEMILKKKN